MTEKKPPLALPLQAPPVQRTEWKAPAAHDSNQGIEAAAKCADLTGAARQMCLASRGVTI